MLRDPMAMILSAVVVVVLYLTGTEGHGRLIEPPSRSSMWRFGFKTPINYNDNQLFCGGFLVQWNVNNGKCGVCGDPYNGPRLNEAGGKYATGTIGRTYREGQTITVTTEITMNHGGVYEFRICPNDDPTRPVTESCLDQHLLAQPNGQTQWTFGPGQPGKISLDLVLPRGLTCSQCVLQWKWRSAANWGCDAAGCGKGHGPQESFINCADVAITSGGSLPHLNPVPVTTKAATPIRYTRPPPPTTTTSTTTKPTTKATNTVAGSGLTGQGMAGGFVPIGVMVGQCEATASFKLRYQFADDWCQTQCMQGNCPDQYCKAACRNMNPVPAQSLFG